MNVLFIEVFHTVYSDHVFPSPISIQIFLTFVVIQLYVLFSLLFKKERNKQETQKSHKTKIKIKKQNTNKTKKIQN